MSQRDAEFSFELSQHVKGKFPDERIIFRGVIFALPGGVFSKGDVKRPVQEIFLSPMTTGCYSKGLSAAVAQ